VLAGCVPEGTLAAEPGVRLTCIIPSGGRLAMAAYLVAEVTVSDPERFRAYQELAVPAVERYGGTFVASSTEPLTLEGEWHPQRIVVVAFDSLARCREFYASPEYQAAIQVRKGAARLGIVAVEGAD
jgi:uncharacterized protein (DUF1330 family)